MNFIMIVFNCDIYVSGQLDFGPLPFYTDDLTFAFQRSLLSNFLPFGIVITFRCILSSIFRFSVILSWDYAPSFDRVFQRTLWVSVFLRHQGHPTLNQQPNHHHVWRGRRWRARRRPRCRPWRRHGCHDRSSGSNDAGFDGSMISLMMNVNIR